MRRIAILDTGVGASEDDFVKLHVKKSFDFTTPKFSESNIGLDDNGHGTTCAKIILKNAAKSEIYSLKVLDKNIILPGGVTHEVAGEIIAAIIIPTIPMVPLKIKNPLFIELFIYIPPIVKVNGN